MKKTLLLLSTIALNHFCFSQAPVTDAAANAQLANLNSQLATLTATISQMNATTTSNQLESQGIKLLNKDQLNLQDIAEKALWQVPQYLKTGEEINSILDTEARILQKLQQLNSNINSGSIPFEFRNNILSQARNILGTVGGMVDQGLNVLSDNTFRMQPEDRRSKLKEIAGYLRITENMVSTLSSQANQIKSQIEQSNSYKQNADNARNKLKIRP